MLMFHGTSTDTMPANRTAGGFRQIIDEIEEETGLEAKVEASDWNIKIELKRGAKMVGYFRASEVSPDSFEWGNAPSDCKEAWGQMGEPPVWVIRGAEWFDRDLRGKGFGKLLYKALFSYIASKKGVVGPDLCSGGNTSPDAQRVWRSLRSMYPKHGPLIDLRKMASPSRVAPLPRTASVSSFMSDYKRETEEADYQLLRNHRVWWDEMYECAVGMALEPHRDHVYIKIIRIEDVDCFGRGKASAVLRHLIQMADKHKVTLALTPEATGSKTLDTSQLKGWYKRMGFAPKVKGSSIFDKSWVRHPGGKTPKNEEWELLIETPGKPDRVWGTYFAENIDLARDHAMQLSTDRDKSIVGDGEITAFRQDGGRWRKLARPSRVASRHREAGLLKAPPKMVDEITEWVQDVTAEWVAQTPDVALIRQAWEAQDHAQSFDTTATKQLTLIRHMLVEWGKKPTALFAYRDFYDATEGTPYARDLPPHLRRREFEALSRAEAQNLHDRISKTLLRPLDRKIKEVSREHRDAVARWKALTKRLTPVEHQMYENSRHPLWGLEVAPEVQEMAARRGSSSGGGEKTEYFTPDWKGWEYAAILESAPNPPKPHKLEVMVNLQRPATEVEGSYTDYSLTLFARVPQLLQSKAGYKKLMRQIRTVVRHELQHYVQDVFREAGIEDFGNPSRNLRDLKYSPAGFAPVEGLDDHQRTQRDLRDHGQKPYPLIDAEFYPWVEDNTEEFREWATNQGLEGRDWDRARKDWVESKGSDIIRAQGTGNARFWKSLKRNEPRKWQKAVGEFWKATEPPRPSRVAARYAAALKVEEWYGKKGRKDHATRRERGTIPTKDALKIDPPSRYHGRREWNMRGGKRYFGNYTEEEWNEFVEDIRRNGIKTPLWIQVDPGKEPQLMEGNHRIQAAAQLGLREVPVTINYYGLAEEDEIVAPSVRRTITHQDADRADR